MKIVYDYIYVTFISGGMVAVPISCNVYSYEENAPHLTLREQLARVLIVLPQEANIEALKSVVCQGIGRAVPGLISADVVLCAQPKIQNQGNNEEWCLLGCYAVWLL
jgi:hypothetical protein